MRAEIVVYGIPAPQGSKSFKGMSKSGRAIMAESSKMVRPWREAVSWAVRDAGSPKIPGAVRMSIVFTMPKPRSAPKRKRTLPDRYPDLSKLIRSTEDALKIMGVYEDDARIVEFGRVAKVFPNEDVDALASPGARIVIEQALAAVGG